MARDGVARSGGVGVRPTLTPRVVCGPLPYGRGTDAKDTFEQYRERERAGSWSIRLLDAGDVLEELINVFQMKSTCGLVIVVAALFAVVFAWRGRSSAPASSSAC